MTDYNGVIKDLIAGKWVNPEDKRKYGIPIKKIEIDSSYPRYIIKNKDKLKNWIA